MTINLFRGRITALLVAASFFVVPAATAQQPESSAPASQMESTDTLILTVENRSEERRVGKECRL